MAWVPSAGTMLEPRWDMRLVQPERTQAEPFYNRSWHHLPQVNWRGAPEMAGENMFRYFWKLKHTIHLTEESHKTYFQCKAVYSPIAHKHERCGPVTFHFHTADFLSTAEEVLDGQKHGFASAGDKARR